MGQVFGIDRSGTLSVASTTSVTLALDTYGGDIRGTIGGQQYRSLTAITVNAATTGANALDTGALTTNKIYYVHYVLSGGNLALVASLSKTSPTGFSLSKFTGFGFTTDGSSQIFQAGLIGNLRTVQRFTSSSGTYNTPIGCTSLRVTMVGGGGGGAGSGTGGAGGGASLNGGTTTFGTSLLTATGGLGGTFGVQGAGGTGGTPTINSPAIAMVSNIGGSGGGAAIYQGGATAFNFGAGAGASSPFGGGAGNTPPNTNGTASPANTGGGGSSGGGNATNNIIVGGGGGAGAYVQAVIANPSATYSYAVGAAGSAGGAGTGGAAGGAGGSGLIVVEEFYG